MAFTDTGQMIETEHGFQWGAAEVARCMSIDGRVVLTVKTSAGKTIDVYVSAEGRSLRVWDTVAHVELRAPTDRVSPVTLKFLSMSDVAEYTGLKLNSLKTLDRTGKFPPADIQVGLGEHKAITRGWSRDTIDEWMANR